MDKQLIEVNGIKLEVDMRYAKRVDTFRVGDPVKVLVKGDSYNAQPVKSGIVAGFEPFKDLPTIIVAYLDSSYSGADLKFAYINSESASKYEIVSALDNELPISKGDVVCLMDRDIAKKEEELRDAKAKREFFLTKFNRYFEPNTQSA